jgi:hypothetical protein
MDMKKIIEQVKKHINLPAVEKDATKKTREDHMEDALYREVNEEVQAQRAYDFVKKHLRVFIAIAAIAVIVVSSIQLIRAQNKKSLRQSAQAYESAIMMMDAGNPVAAREALVRAAKKSSGGMADLALFSAARIDLQTGNNDAGMARLEQLAKDGSSRDFRDLALLNLAVMKVDDMSPKQFEQYLAPVQTKRSPFYYTGMLLVAQKYLAAGDAVPARRWLDKITSDKDAPASIAVEAEMLK